MARSSTYRRRGSPEACTAEMARREIRRLREDVVELVNMLIAGNVPEATWGKTIDRVEHGLQRLDTDLGGK